MIKLIQLLLLTLLTNTLTAQTITGKVTNANGTTLPNASITVTNKNIQVVTNATGNYSLKIPNGTYTISCQYIGYALLTQTITISKEEQQLNFVLQIQAYKNTEFIVKANAEDYAYTVIRNAIKKRNYYNTQVKSATYDLYNKEIMKLRSVPKSFMGKKIKADDKKDMGVDSSGKGVVYLSESISQVNYELPNKTKIFVKSSRVSGSNSYGFAFTSTINFYENNVAVFSKSINSRGFVSPIANNALHYYKYEYLGSFDENGMEINTIKVTPKRKNEPLFSGTIYIVENEWSIHSINLLLTKQSQLELMDTLSVKQLYQKLPNKIWRTNNQALYLAIKIFAFDVVGNFVSVYSNFEVNKKFDPKFFNNTIIKYDTAVNKKPFTYWDSIRPIALEQEEIKDYKIKDSLYLAQKKDTLAKAKMDSMQKKFQKITLNKIVLTGINNYKVKHKKLYSYGLEPLLLNTQYNTTEGLTTTVLPFVQVNSKALHATIKLMPQLRYSYTNNTLLTNSYITFFKKNKKGDASTKLQSITLGGGAAVYQINKEEPINAFNNTYCTLIDGLNFLKNYKANFGEVIYRKRKENSLTTKIGLLYEDRIALKNISNYTLSNKTKGKFQPNDSSGNTSIAFANHQALLVQVALSYQPGQRYIELPYNKVSIGSKWPTFSIYFAKGINNILNSDVDFDKWKFSIKDNINLKLKGTLAYNVTIGGFMNRKKVYIQDYQHFNGNQLGAAADYLNSFQLAQYYANSTTANLFTTVHLEQHLKGLLSNKIPLLNKLNWQFVTGGNAFYVNKNSNYVEAFVGIENIFKILRVDFVAAYTNGKKGLTGIKFGAGGLLGGRASVNTIKHEKAF